MHMKNDQQGYPRSVPKPYNKLGLFWYHSMLQSYMIQRPNDYFAHILADAKNKADWGSIQRPLLSLHVRHGDSCSPEQEEGKKRRCEPLEVYMKNAVLPMAKK